jgi:uncharacterized protein (DUF433 family)
MIDWSTCSAVERDPDRVSGAWVFRGTRVSVTALSENLESGASVAQFLEWFPGVTIDQVRIVLEHAALAEAGDCWLKTIPGSSIESRKHAPACALDVEST